MLINTPIDSLPGTSSVTIKKFQSLDINTYNDLLNYFPVRYENYSLISKIAQVQEGEVVTLQGTVIKVKNQYTRSRITIQKITIEDDTGTIEVVWYNQPFLIKSLKEGIRVSIAGSIKQFMQTYSLEPKEYEILKETNDPLIHTGRIVPIYSEKRGLSSRTIRQKVHRILESPIEIDEFLPEKVVEFNTLIDEKNAYTSIHFPSSTELLQKAIRRLSFDELFTTQLATQLVKADWKKEKVTNPFTVDTLVAKKIKSFIRNLPFVLTNAQNRVTQEIIDDLKKTEPMNRFVQGDVGSGKTVIAAIGSYVAFLSGHQSLIMAPTEILAQQHYLTISKLFAPYNLKIGLQTGSKKINKATNIDDYDIIIGTHALLSAKLSFKNVGFVVIDEQHRFGVAQRATLKNKGFNPHLLTMTATPIPRTVMLTLYGELDLSVIDEMPKGRLPIKTFVVPPEKILKGFEWIKKQIRESKVQVFFIYPLIEESDVETLKSIKAATKEYEYLKEKIFPEFSIGLLHGRMKSKEKEEVMTRFKNREYTILVSTSVVEVGIDIPNATIIVIEGAQRFGMAQLHQLRGRVGRGDKQSYCLLFTDTKEDTTLKRLNFFATTTNGMSLAEYDLKRRGPGDMYGKRQHGYSDLKIANLSDSHLIDETKRATTYFMNHYKINEYPLLQKRVQRFNLDQISRD